MDKVVAIFPFTNTGDTPVTITEARSGCDCTVIGMDQKTYSPGEAGELRAVFDPRGRSGIQEKTIQVSTSDGAVPMTLTLRVKIFEIVAVTPRLFWWEQGSEPSPKEAVITIAPGVVRPHLAVHCEHPEISARLTDGDGAKRTLVVFPRSTAKTIRATVYLTVVAAENEMPRVYAIYAQVR